MVVKRYKWKLDHGEASRIREARVKEERNWAETRNEEMAKNPFLKGMFKGPSKATSPKVPQKQPAATKGQPKTATADKGPTAGETRTADRARGRAEVAHQAAKVKYCEFNNNVLKTRRPPVESDVGKEGAKKQAVTKDATRPTPKGEQGNVKTAKMGVESAARHAKPEGSKKKGAAKRAAQTEQDVKGELKGGRRAKVENRNTAEGAKSDSNSAQAQTKGEGAHVANQAGVVGGGLHQTGRAAGKRGGVKGKRVESKGRKGKRGESGRVSYTGASGDVRGSKNAEILKTLVGGGGTESPFDMGPQEGRAAAAEYEPVEWKTGVENFTGVTKSEEVRLAAVEHRQRTEKPLLEEVDYKNWDLSKQAIAERFIVETSQMMEYAQQIIRDARLPKDPRGLGTRC